MRKLYSLTRDILIDFFKLNYKSHMFSNMCLSDLKLRRGLRCNKFRHLCSILHSLCLVVSYFACLSLLLCHFSCRPFRWCFQGEENNAEEISPAKLLACYDNAQSKILGLRHRSLSTDGLHWVRSLLQPYSSRLVVCFFFHAWGSVADSVIVIWVPDRFQLACWSYGELLELSVQRPHPRQPPHQI